MAETLNGKGLFDFGDRSYCPHKTAAHTNEERGQHWARPAHDRGHSLLPIRELQPAYRPNQRPTRQTIIILQVSAAVYRVGRAARHRAMAKAPHCPMASHPPHHEHRAPHQPQRKDPERFRGRRY